MTEVDWQRYDQLGTKPLGWNETRHLLGAPKNDLTPLGPTFFNAQELRGSLNLLRPGLGEPNASSQQVSVYFDVSSSQDIVSPRSQWEGAGRWWAPLKDDFLPRVEGLPAGVETRYWYGPDHNSYATSNFNPDAPPYQMFVDMFGGALKAFSCFVGKDRPKFDISSWQHMGSKVGVPNTPRSFWRGSIGDLLGSASRVESALTAMKDKGYTLFESPVLDFRGDIRVIHPGSGMIVMRSHLGEARDYSAEEGSHTVEIPRTIILKNGPLDSMVA